MTNELQVDLESGTTVVVPVSAEKTAELIAMHEAELSLSQRIEAILSKQANTQIMVEALWDEFRPFLASILAGTPQVLTFGEMMAKVAQRYLAEGGEV